MSQQTLANVPMCWTPERPCKLRLRSDLVRPLRSSSLDEEKDTDMGQVHLNFYAMTKGSPGGMEPTVTPSWPEEVVRESFPGVI